ncbi:MAG TPA: hypothetical protein VGI78_25990 [Acetobacteraceae bacterium]|jgi:hypothetical protein
MAKSTLGTTTGTSTPMKSMKSQLQPRASSDKMANAVQGGPEPNLAASMPAAAARRVAQPSGNRRK